MSVSTATTEPVEAEAPSPPFLARNYNQDGPPCARCGLPTAVYKWHQGSPRPRDCEANGLCLVNGNASCKAPPAAPRLPEAPSNWDPQRIVLFNVLKARAAKGILTKEEMVLWEVVGFQ